MKQLIGLIALTAILCLGFAPLTYAADEPAAAGSQTVKGDLLKIEGEIYVVKDAAGKEVRLHVDRSTRLEGNIRTGDKIEAQATEKGHATLIKPAM
jgi:uncharacterized protein YdeI (BOF family)